MSSFFQEIVTAAWLFGLLLVSLEVGYRAGRRAASDSDPPASAQVGAVQGAILGLLGLLLAFSFSGAASRFIERQDLIVQEANAIGTAYLRADLLDEPHRLTIQAALRQYTERRIEVSSRLASGITPADLIEVDRMHQHIWDTAIAGVTARPNTMVSVLPAVNEVIDLHSTRVAAGLKHVPTAVLTLLIACSALAVAVMGLGCGLGGYRRAPLTVPLAMLIAASLWITIDLDQPRRGMLQLDDGPLKALKFDAAP